jgi:biotin-(acetyl-CoA carboxylase) ligase
MVITNAYDGKTASLFAEWERCSSSLGRKVRFEHEGMVMQGSINGLTSSGTLLVKRDNAEVTEVLSGEITYL